MLLAVFVVSGILPVIASGHSVAQVQTTKFFAPETVQLLKDRAIAGSPGFVVGDTVSYVVQFTPVSNGSATLGVAGYVTDYIPAGTEVVGAAMVEPSGATYVNVAPDLPGPTADGWGPQGRQTWLAAPFNNGNYDALLRPGGTGQCVVGNARCNGRLADLAADTGIFYSTDPRTAIEVLPNTDGRARQGTNGYLVTPTRRGQLFTVMGGTTATTHNQWDADQTNAFGSTTLPTASAAFPKVSSAVRQSTPGAGNTPFNVGSPVAGPLTGYKLDNTGNIGPWQRIAYPGSRIGSSTAAPATAAGASIVAGGPTTAGVTLSPASPLPATTNAVRWAIGRLTVGQNRYVKIQLRLTAPVPVTGIINNSEVFGGDAANAPDTSPATRDSPWPYHVPSVADNNSNLFIYKEVVSVNGVADDGVTIPANAAHPDAAKVLANVLLDPRLGTGRPPASK